jgi:hypothetical protein
MTDPPSDAQDALRPRSPWRSAAIWTLPIGLWIVLSSATGIGSLAQAVSWKHDHEGWVSIIDVNREEGYSEIVAAQEETLREDDRKSLEGLAALVLGFALSMGLAWLYRRKVPPSRRGGVRGLALAIALLGVLGTVGYVLLGVLLKGAIKG